MRSRAHGRQKLSWGLVLSATTLTGMLLVEVPTIISFSSLQRIAEQNVDIPVVGGSGTGGGPSGFSPWTALFYDCRADR